MIQRRAMVAGSIIAAWLAGLAVLVQREYFRPQLERLAEAATRITPGAVFFAVLQGDRQVGFASSTIDTAKTSITINDYFVADLAAGKKGRASARTSITLTRRLHVTAFDFSLDGAGAPARAGGRVEGDSVLVFARGAADSQRVALAGPILLPTLVPLAVALGERPKVGKRYVLPVLDPASMSANTVTVHVQAESVFTVSDSAVFDSATARWHGITPDTVRAWRLTTDINAAGDGSGGFAGWIDAQGRVMRTTQLGYVLQRMPYEVAFENWRADSGRVAADTDRDIVETTLIAANRRLDGHVHSLRVRLSGASLAGFDVDGRRQHLFGDTLLVSDEPESALVTRERLPLKARDADNARPERLIESDDQRILALAHIYAGGSDDARVVAERLTTSVHRMLRPHVTAFGVPSAVKVRFSRAGDCNEYTQLYVALARSIGLRARAAVGLAYVDGKFYYHAWPEVLLGDWVAVDPTFGQFPADAAHLRFAVGGLERQTDLLRLIGTLKIDVLSVNGAPPPRRSTNSK